MIYVALLRGINVGGNNKIDMKTLKQVFEQAGMASVKTYINSGNIIFSDNSRSKLELTEILEEAIYANFALKIKVLIYSYEEYKPIAEAIPPSWTNDSGMKGDVLFLWEEVNTEAVLEQLIIKPEIDQVLYIPGAILWGVERQLATRSGLGKLVGTKLYKQMTVRNVNTVRKLNELMRVMEE